MRRKRTNLSRRNFLRGAALGAAAVGIQPILSLNPARAADGGNPRKFMVVVNMLGGNDGLNTVCPTHLSAYTDRRPNISLALPANIPSTEALHALDGRYQLHYGMDNFKTMWDADDLHIVQKVSYPNPNQSHFTSQDIYSFGVRDYGEHGDGRGWLGRFADEFCANPSEPLGVIAVGVGRRRDFEADETQPLILSTVENFKIDEDRRYRADHALRIAKIRETLETDADPSSDPALTIFSTNQQAHELVDRVREGTADWVAPTTAYPNNNLGNYMKTISKLLHGHADFGTRVFYTGYGGFDTHSGELARHDTLLGRLDQVMGVFREDMIAKGLWNDCVVVVISEFGRRVFENGSFGTDHGHGNAFLVAGGAVKGEQAAGGMTGDITESDIADNNTLPFGYDFRDIYGNIVNSHMGISQADAAKLFPDPGYTPSWGDLDLA